MEMCPVEQRVHEHRQVQVRSDLRERARVGLGEGKPRSSILHSPLQEREQHPSVLPDIRA
ncbi:hypothetical protein BN140_0376 [Methanoculleus bourgensis MS2]|uniref:Uncharacterized protein n=1 Tax=Methanoculleus bourgensis (strain ATCC 43281 / DSM 3045 / OCM 15 / MS2) TaxID=1201294 RepID=I7LLE6_METBM|nr:hypothetical protein BN140_0376 [Methanoculleus bourgensis MS2]